MLLADRQRIVSRKLRRGCARLDQTEASRAIRAGRATSSIPLYREAIGKHPTSFHLYTQRAETLEPRWFGAEGELNEYADSLLQDPGGDVGRMASSFIAIQQFGHRYGMRQFYEKTGLRWAT